MKIQYLGTAASEGWPAVFCQCGPCKEARRLGGRNIRRRSSAIVNDSLLIDLPPDIYGSSLNLGVDLSQIMHIAVTHNHSDHLYAAEINNAAEPFAYHTDGVPLRIYGSGAVAGTIREALGSDYLGWAEIEEVLPFASFSAAGCTVTPLPANHGAPQSMIFLVESAGKTLLYANDTGLLLEETLDFLRGRWLDAVSMDCTIQDGDKYVCHMSITDNVQTKQTLLDMGAADDRTVFIATHFSHNGGLLHDELTERLRPYGIVAAYDGMKVEF